MADSFHLLVSIPGSNKVIAYPIIGDSVTLGRGPDNGIQLLLVELSTLHCQFVKTETGYAIADHGSTNGTRVNELSIKNGMVELSDRDSVVLGETLRTWFVATEAGTRLSVAKLYTELEEAATQADFAKLNPEKTEVVQLFDAPKDKPRVSRPLPLNRKPAARPVEETVVSRKPPVKKMTRSAYEAMVKTQEVPKPAMRRGPTLAKKKFGTVAQHSPPANVVPLDKPKLKIPRLKPGPLTPKKPIPAGFGEMLKSGSAK